MIKNRNVSIITDENNNQIVIINDKKFKGLSKDDWQQIEITETNDVVYIGKEFPSEYAGSKSRIALKGARKKAKASASQGIPELIKIAKNPRWEENKEQKHNKDAKYGWYRYDIRFGLPVYDDKTGNLDRYNIFTAILLIKHSEDGNKYLHDKLYGENPFLLIYSISVFLFCQEKNILHHIHNEYDGGCFMSTL